MTTITLDITEGKSRAQLAHDYVRCLRAASLWQQIAMALVDASPGAVKDMPQGWREEIERMIEAYKD